MSHLRICKGIKYNQYTHLHLQYKSKILKPSNMTTIQFLSHLRTSIRTSMFGLNPKYTPALPSTLSTKHMHTHTHTHTHTLYPVARSLSIPYFSTKLSFILEFEGNFIILIVKIEVFFRN